MRSKSWILFLLGALLALTIAPAAFAQAGTAKVRVVHASPDAPAVDVIVNGNKALTNVPFFAASAYLDLPAGSYDIQVVPAGATSPVVIDAKGVRIEAGKAYTIAATGKLAEIKPTILIDNLSAPAAGKAHVRVIHFSPDAPAVDIKVAGGPTLISNLAFPQASNYLPVDAGSYDLQVTPAGGTAVVLDLKGVLLEAGKIYDVFAVGELASIKVETAVTTPPAAPAALPRTGGETSIALIALVAAATLIGAGLVLRRRRLA
jgi:LPXTG-motif cell wall-anchored protein